MPPENKSEFETFFGNLPTEDQRIADVFDEKKPEEARKDEPKAEDGEVATPEKDDEPRKNRRHRRLEQQLTSEREARIAAEARAEAVSEFGARVQDNTVDERLLRMYGPEHIEAAKLHMELLTDYAAKAEEQAIRKMEERAANAAQEAKAFEVKIDQELEAIEDEYDVDVTSDSPAARKTRRELLELVQKLSPKDADGLVSDFADFGEVWELYQSKAQAKPAPTRAKEIAARSMENGSVGAPPAPKQTPGFRGWMKDFQITNP